jgi:anthranilate synthase component 2
MNVLVIDNNDSFVYNLVQYLEESGAEVCIKKNTEIEFDEVRMFSKILLSPGPGLPEEAGKLKALIREFSDSKSILGVCLGLQAIGEVFGGKLENLNYVVHGKSSKINILAEDETLFSGIENFFSAGRYHSWVLSKENFPDELEITSIDESQQIMSVRHRDFDVRAVQFHPESILTPSGKKIIENWVNS